MTQYDIILHYTMSSVVAQWVQLQTTTHETKRAGSTVIPTGTQGPATRADSIRAPPHMKPTTASADGIAAPAEHIYNRMRVAPASLSERHALCVALPWLHTVMRNTLHY